MLPCEAISDKKPITWEEVPILVEADSHDTFSGVESLLHAVAVVDVNVNIQHPVGGMSTCEQPGATSRVTSTNAS